MRAWRWSLVALLALGDVVTGCRARRNGDRPTLTAEPARGVPAAPSPSPRDAGARDAAVRAALAPDAASAASPARPATAADAGAREIAVGDAFPREGVARVVSRAGNDGDPAHCVEFEERLRGAMSEQAEMVLQIGRRPRRIRLFGRSEGAFALLVPLGDQDPVDNHSCARAAGGLAVLDLHDVAAQTALRVRVMWLDGARTDVLVGAVADDAPIPTRAAPAAPAPAAGDVIGTWEIGERPGATGSFRLVLSGALQRVIPVALDWDQDCWGEADPLPSVACNAGMLTLGIRSLRSGGYEVNSSAENDGACFGPTGEATECPDRERATRRARFTLPAGMRLVGNPLGVVHVLPTPDGGAPPP
jgi:hypothetical protein